ncbi:hypothetical protein [Spirillospora sp. CA-128828]|uniref:hypothetical protein n=1 Tax=Spirillospora sp. CA-128828 TaxID=3240033 RepID=UPI003D923427
MAASNKCPVWCDQRHPDGAVHRGEVGETTVSGLRIPVVILQVPGGPADVAISGPVYVEIHADDRDDMAELLGLAGQHALAGLVRQADALARGGAQ